MKIRLKGNSIRFRLTQSEVSQLGQNGSLTENTAFAGTALEYAIVVTDEEGISVEHVNHRITLYISRHMAVELVETDKVGYSDSNGPVAVLIEKDFTCLDHVEEDQSDNYPNPRIKD
ncbi:DUF7009 family protein [Pedobacter rhizosphaerae]|uniref:Uncharacterized protein n=1 Tax=Pedobacter rhizosphaerae TaxID=390241 RepID=A0A1H9SFT3_9SPHI|nr:hypothetical protein [Pedobacter rhizosphaerae]SER83880.1 hypothetical protein SAMN04488023_1183 [Pedobacter rhizosphaerae]